MDLENVVFNVVRTVKIYEKGFTSVKRNPVDYQVRVYSFSDFIENRINFESFKDDSLRPLEEAMDSNLFTIDSIEGERLIGGTTSYNRLTVRLSDKPSAMSEEEYEDIRSKFIELIGGECISFTSNKNKLDIVIS